MAILDTHTVPVGWLLCESDRTTPDWPTMTSILLLPLLAFVAAENSGPMRSKHRSEITAIRTFNGSEAVLNCPPAELLVRTHMAPDFEHPQLVRRLDWFQGDMLVASFQQVGHFEIANA